MNVWGKSWGISWGISWGTVIITPGGLKVWLGSWIKKPLKVWTGTAWVEKPLLRWNGESWSNS
jgi:hypothetical protein